MGNRKVLKTKFFTFIQAQPCHFGGILVKLPGYPRFCTQDWDEALGQYKSEVSHILRKGSIRRQMNEGNIFPNCRMHHAWFEGLTPEIRETYLPIGQLYLSLFHE